MGRKTPYIVFVSDQGTDIEVKHFKSRMDTMRWCRSEGLKFGNQDFVAIEDFELVLQKDGITYEIQEEAIPL